jgi:hypothetical protein
VFDFQGDYPKISFNEKITNLNLIHLDSMQPMTTTSTLDEFPGSFSLGVDLDLFNVKANRKYQIQVYSQAEKQLQEQLIHVANVYIPKDEFMVYEDGFGTTTGSFSFGFTPAEEGDYKISFKLYDVENTKVLDECNQYLYLSKR